MISLILKGFCVLLGVALILIGGVALLLINAGRALRQADDDNV
jgi:hypothetical protein